ncbi:MAG TPA: glycosyltransferase family 4 protein [Thermoanaerobaculia bacterium]|nr:glycosyltransferase family 4 protein [Thermoanaerobaculia bacterium]
MSEPMRIVYLLEGTSLFGGVKVVLRQANLLAARGHECTVVSREPRPDWMALEARFRQVADLVPAQLPEADVVVATFWTTIGAARRAPAREAVHYCQGLEYTYTHNGAEHAAIRAAYRNELPALCVAPHLAEHLRREYGRPARVVPQPLEAFMRPLGRLRPHRRPRILVTGPFEIDWKGVATALEAVHLLRQDGFDCRLVRLSQWPLTEAEKEQALPEEYHCHLQPSAVAALIQSCDLLLAPSWEQEGFGLPVLEAFACGLPVVASDVSCFRSFARGAATLVPADSPQAFAHAAREALTRTDHWRRMRHAGLLRAEDYTEQKAAAAAEAALSWVAEGAWRAER